MYKKAETFPILLMFFQALSTLEHLFLPRQKNREDLGNEGREEAAAGRAQEMEKVPCISMPEQTCSHMKVAPPTALSPTVTSTREQSTQLLASKILLLSLMRANKDRVPTTDTHIASAVLLLAVSKSRAACCATGG